MTVYCNFPRMDMYSRVDLKVHYREVWDKFLSILSHFCKDISSWSAMKLMEKMPLLFILFDDHVKIMRIYKRYLV